MSYTSESVLPKTVTLAQAQDVIALLGYKKVSDGSYFWYEEKDYRSYVGLELDIYQKPSGRIVITTRSRAGRSYWDLTQQNKTLKLIRDLFGGYFTTDPGRNRYWRPDGPPPSPLSSGLLYCTLAISQWPANGTGLPDEPTPRGANRKGYIVGP